MKIAIIDFFLPDGHKSLNSRYINLLSEFYQIFLIHDGEYFSSILPNHNIEVRNVGLSKCKDKGKIVNRINVLKNMRKIYKILCQEQDIDAVVVLTYEILTFALYGHIFTKLCPIYLFEHNSIDELENSIKRKCYKTFQNKVNHLVLEEVFKDYMRDTIGVDYDKIFVIHHCLRSVNDNRKILTSTGKVLVNLSRTSDEKWIEQLIEEEKRTRFLNYYDIKMILRSRYSEFDDGNLQIIQGDLSSTQYNELLQKADSIIVLSSDFKYRVSGSIFDALSIEKNLISLKLPVVEYLQKLCPTMIQTFETLEQFKQIVQTSKFEKNLKELEIIKCLYSDDTILQDWRKALEKRCN